MNDTIINIYGTDGAIKMNDDKVIAMYNKNIAKSPGGGLHRDITIDLLKGIGVILMVYRHTEAPLSKFVLLFHMAIFFMSSGYLFNPERVKGYRNLKKYIIRKIKSLWLPFVGFSTVFVLLNNAFIYLNIYTDNAIFIDEYVGRYSSLASSMTISEMVRKIIYACLLQDGPQMGGALWFFQALFYLSVGYAIIEFFLQKVEKNKNRRFLTQGIISSCFLVLGYICSLKGIYGYGINRFLSYYCLYYVGNLIKQYHLMDAVVCKRYAITFVCLSFFALAVMNAMGISISIVDNDYMNPTVLLVASVLGWIMVFSLASLLKTLRFPGNRLLEYISVHSVPIIGLHFLAFKLVNLLAVCVTNQGKYMIAAFPVLMHGAWWILYLVTGIVLPLILSYEYSCFKIYIKKIRKKT